MEQVTPYTPSQDEKMTAMLAHVVQIFSGFLGPLVIYLTKRDSRFVAFHAIQALILQGTYFVVMVLIVGGWSGVSLFITSEAERHGSGSKALSAFFPIFVLILCACAAAYWVTMLILGILHGVKSVNGEWSQYPLIGRWARRWAGIAPKNFQSAANDSSPQPPGY